MASAIWRYLYFLMGLVLGLVLMFYITFNYTIQSLGIISLLCCVIATGLVMVIVAYKTFFSRKKAGEANNLNKYAIGGLLLGVFSWILLLFYIISSPEPSGYTTLTASGFAKIKPQLAGTGIMASGRPYAVLINVVGSRITFTGGRIRDLNHAESCALTGEMFEPNPVTAWEYSRLSGSGLSGCIKPGSPGDNYNAEITLDYEITVEGVTSAHTERGTLRGPME